ncbi:hypothetical protein Goshw_003365 [Gossypium schwendimanii]|uniref:Uncharacterized protein n=1 Tax=Gossypium schwendimanii TaxID=34291 RepID=A0A7J9NFE9_GOSSC|nr:hypothetical protein [Gossypium schwendimanii]
MTKSSSYSTVTTVVSIFTRCQSGLALISNFGPIC